MGVYIIAEAGVNHNGSLDLALKLCDEAKETGADAIKFQTWKTEKLITKYVRMADYQQGNMNVDNMSQYEMLKKLELSYEEFRMIKNYCDQIGLNFLSTPDEEESLAFLVSLNLDIIKIGSGEITNIPYLRKVGSTNKKIILSTGMSTIGDVDRAFSTIKCAGAKDISLLHCTTAYPCPMSEVNLHVISTLKHAFQCPVGYSDHTLGIEVAIAAVALGAVIIEKHFTLDRQMNGPDHLASLDPDNFKQMVNSVRNIENALGNYIKEPNEKEKQIAQVVQKGIVARIPIRKGEPYTENNITVKRSSEGLSAAYWDLVIGLKAQNDYSTDDPISLQ